MEKKVICVLCGGQSTEHEVSLLSAKNVLAAMSPEKYSVLVVGIAKDGTWRWYENGDFAVNTDNPSTVKLASGGTPVAPIRLAGKAALAILDVNRAPVAFDVLFPVLHGVNGEDGSVQGLAQLLGCPFVGCPMTASAICMDKVFAKEILEYNGIRTAHWITLQKGEPLPSVEDVVTKLGMPLFVKPANAGSSVGVVKVTSREQFADAVAEAMKYDSKVLVEECIVGREIECAVLGNDQLFCAVPGEVVPKVAFYSYDAKYTMADGAELVAPAPLTQVEIDGIHKIAAKAYKALGCRGMARVDFFLRKDGTWILNELNTIPGFTKISMYPRLMGLSGIPYSELIDRLIQLALT